MSKSSKWILAIAIVAIVWGLINEDAHADTSFSRNLYYGIQGSADVQALQEFLTVHRYYNGPITGNFFSLTTQGVKNFQTANGVPTTGYFGVLSRKAASNILTADNPTPSQQEGSTDTSQATSTSPQVQPAIIPTQDPTPDNGGNSPIPGIIGSGESTTSIPQVTPAAQAIPDPEVVLPTCLFSVEVIKWPQGTWHAKFSWTFTEGANAVITSNGNHVDLTYGPGDPASITRNNNMGFSNVYGPSIFGNTPYTLTVSNGNGDFICHTTAVIPPQ